MNANKLAEIADEYVAANPKYLVEFLDRHPDLLTNYVIENVDEATIAEWLEKAKSAFPDDVLRLLRVDFLKEKNCLNHKTENYVHDNLIVRRGATFTLDVFFKSRIFLPEKDQMSLVFSIGPDPDLTNGTRFWAPVESSLQKDKWSCQLVSQDEEAKKMELLVNIPVDTIIGRYKLEMEVSTELTDGIRKERKSQPDIIVIFNPFEESDSVYMEEEEARQEYVLNDEGIIYKGQHNGSYGIPWIFGQFEEGILDISLKILQDGNRMIQNPVKNLKKRNSPVYCSRVFSAMMNDWDDNGVLVGNWSDNYAGGTKPGAWNGSVDILRQWRQNNTHVKYGQCWVYSGVLTTVLRALGIPARSVTNFASAHDTEFNMTIDVFVDKDGEKSDLKSSGDSVWNFHVWNEGWFRRPDLPKGYDGWQAIDGTPQEQSNGIHQCGPAPLKAIKNGEIYIGSDTNFLFAEVNADYVIWEVDAEGKVVAMVKRYRRWVGQNISTKAIGSDLRNVITDQYKFPEGSKEEAAAFKRAYAHCNKPDYHKHFDFIEKEGDITIDIKPVAEAVAGQNMNFKIEVANTTGEDKKATITTIFHTLLHNGVRKTLLKREKSEKQVKAVDLTTIKLPFSNYGRHLTGTNVIRVETTVYVNETKKLYYDWFDVDVTNPECITIGVEEPLKRYQPNQLDIIINNPLPVSLTEGVITVEGSGLSTKVTFNIPEPIEPYSSFRTKDIKVFPYRRGKKNILVDFDCNEMSDVKAKKQVMIG